MGLGYFRVGVLAKGSDQHGRVQPGDQDADLVRSAFIDPELARDTDVTPGLAAAADNNEEAVLFLQSFSGPAHILLSYGSQGTG